MRIALDGPNAAPMIDGDIGRGDDLRAFGEKADLHARIERFRQSLSRGGSASNRQNDDHHEEAHYRKRLCRRVFWADHIRPAFTVFGRRGPRLAASAVWPMGHSRPLQTSETENGTIFVW